MMTYLVYAAALGLFGLCIYSLIMTWRKEFTPEDPIQAGMMSQLKSSNDYLSSKCGELRLEVLVLTQENEILKSHLKEFMVIEGPGSQALRVDLTYKDQIDTMTHRVMNHMQENK